MESDADRLAALRALGGESATAPAGVLEGIFDAAYLAAFADPGIEGASPAFTCRDSDISSLKLRKGEPLSIRGMVYRIMRIEPDSTGMSVLVLKS
jgi:hypothetical protein